MMSCIHSEDLPIVQLASVGVASCHSLANPQLAGHMRRDVSTNALLLVLLPDDLPVLLQPCPFLCQHSRVVPLSSAMVRSISQLMEEYQSIQELKVQCCLVKNNLGDGTLHDLYISCKTKLP